MNNANNKGQLYLLPVPLGENAMHTLPDYVKREMHRLDYFIAERAKTARHFLKESGIERPLPTLTIYELNKRTDAATWRTFLQAAEQGHDIGLLSEAGCPGVADPGAAIVALAHELNIRVIPLVGPSSILLALMASGMNGQSFVFHGYLSPKKPALARDLKQLEQQARKLRQTQLFIETPYRNEQVVEVALKTLAPNTRLCIAVDISLPNEWIKTATITEWKRLNKPNLHKRPAIFLVF